MRHIEFRGKLLCKPERWVYGFYIFYFADDRKEYRLIYSGTYPSDNDASWTSYIVKPDTIGQYIGLHDKNGTKIFEGDLVKYEDGRTFAIKYSESLARFIPCLPNGAFNPAVFSNCEIVGNIYDNPDWDKAKADE